MAFACRWQRLTHYLDTLHQRQPDRLVSGQTDHTCRSVWSGLQQSHNCFHSHPACLYSGRAKSTSIRLFFINYLNCVRLVYYSFTRILSKAEGVPPLCTWPKIVLRVSKPSFFVTSWQKSTWLQLPYVQLYLSSRGMLQQGPQITCLIWSQVIGLPVRSIAPSATIRIFKREPRPLCWWKCGEAHVQNAGKWLKCEIMVKKHLHQPVVCRDAPPIHDLGASLG